MASTIRVLAGFVVFFSLTFIIFAQGSIPEKPGTSTISGKVTIEGKPAPNVMILLTKNNNNNNQNEPPTSTTTDASGAYKLEKIRAGSYAVGVTAAGFYNPKKGNEWDRGTEVNLSDNDSAEAINFALVRGAVLTGRLFDERGRSVIEQQVVLMKQGADGKKQTINCNDQSDDRGVYRCYGVEPGKYIVGAGSDPKSGDLQIYEGRKYSRAWYPGVHEEEKATIIEVKIETESTGIDIKLSQKKKNFRASGKLVDTINGKGVPNVMIGSSALNEDGDMTGMTMGSIFSNAEGEFKLEGLTTGKYRVMAANFEGSSDYFGNSLLFEIKDEDISGLEVKMEKGAVISGVVKLEEGAAPESKNKLSMLRMIAQSTDPNADPRDWSANFPSTSAVDPAGNFKFKGVRTGKVNFSLDNNVTKEFSVVRVERDGSPLMGGIEVKSGDQISGLRIIVAQGSATIRGEIKVEGGTLPENVSLNLSAKSLTNSSDVKNGSVDSRGKFVLEGLATGSYELSVGTYLNKPPFDKPSVTLQKNSKNVQVVTGQETSVTLTVSIGGKEEK